MAPTTIMIMTLTMLGIAIANRTGNLSFVNPIIEILMPGIAGEDTGPLGPRRDGIARPREILGEGSRRSSIVIERDLGTIIITGEMTETEKETGEMIGAGNGTGETTVIEIEEAIVKIAIEKKGTIVIGSENVRGIAMMTDGTIEGRIGVATAETIDEMIKERLPANAEVTIVAETVTEPRNGTDQDLAIVARVIDGTMTEIVTRRQNARKKEKGMTAEENDNPIGSCIRSS